MIAKNNNQNVTEDESLLVLFLSATMRRLGVQALSFTEDELLAEALQDDQMALRHEPGQPWIFERVTDPTKLPIEVQTPSTRLVQ